MTRIRLWFFLTMLCVGTYVMSFFLLRHSLSVTFDKSERGVQLYSVRLYYFSGATSVNSVLYYAYAPLRYVLGCSSMDQGVLVEPERVEEAWDGKPVYIYDVAQCYEHKLPGFDQQ